MTSVVHAFITSMLLVAAACGSDGDASDGSASTSVSEDPNAQESNDVATDSEPSDDETVTPDDPGDDASDHAADSDDNVAIEPAVPPSGVRDQLERYGGGDLIEFCGVAEIPRPDIDDPPPAFFGLAGVYDRVLTQHAVGTSLPWCVYDFEPSVPIEVTIVAPDGRSTSSEVVLTSDETACWVACSLTKSLLPTGSDGMRIVGYASPYQAGNGQVSGWIPVGAMLGSYGVTARQASSSGERVSVSSFDVVASTTPVVAVAGSSDESSAFEVFVVGHAASSPVEIGLYSATTETWNFVMRLPDALTDDRGEAHFQFDVGGLAPNRYCLLTSATALQPDDSVYEDPCNESWGTNAGFWVGPPGTVPVSADTPDVAVAGPLSTGDRSSRVETLQQALVDRGYLGPDDVDGRFGPDTEGAVVAFQEDAGLEVDGIAGPATHEALGLPFD